MRQRTSTARSYKIETVEDSGDDAKQTTQIVIQTTAPPQATITQAPQQQHHQNHHHQPQHISAQQQTLQTHQLTSVSMPTTATTTVVTHKRPAQRSLGSVPHIKRTKSTIDPLEASDASVATQQINVQTTVVAAESKPQPQAQQQQTQIQQQQANETEYIDLPIELPTKSEPDYGEEHDMDQAEQDANYVEDESYGDIRYDESYFTENEDAGAAAAAAAQSAVAGNTSTTVATTSKAIVKQQPLSDSSYMESTGGDQANSDAQG